MRKLIITAIAIAIMGLAGCEELAGLSENCDDLLALVEVTNPDSELGIRARRAYDAFCVPVEDA